MGLERGALAAASGLATLSERGRVVRELNDPAVRDIFVYRYRLLYEVTTSEVRMRTWAGRLSIV